MTMSLSRAIIFFLVSSASFLYSAAGGKSIDTQLLDACLRRPFSLEVAQSLFAARADVNSIDSKGQTLVYHVINHFFTDEGIAGPLKFLTNSKAEIEDIGAERDRSALQMAGHKNLSGTVNLLLLAGANLSREDDDGQNAINSNYSDRAINFMIRQHYNNNKQYYKETQDWSYKGNDLEELEDRIRAPFASGDDTQGDARIKKAKLDLEIYGWD